MAWYVHPEKRFRIGSTGESSYGDEVAKAGGWHPDYAWRYDAPRDVIVCANGAEFSSHSQFARTMLDAFMEQRAPDAENSLWKMFRGGGE